MTFDGERERGARRFIRMGTNYGSDNGVRGTVIWGVVALMVMISVGAAETFAGWRIDGRRFLQSVHSETTCRECHSDIDLENNHPDPANVNKTMASFFNRDKCLQCHDEVRGQIENDGAHDGETVEDEQRFFNCIECHDPHYDGAPATVADSDGARFTQEDEICAACHLRIAPDDTQRAAKNRSMCFTCHGAGQLMPGNMPRVDPKAYQTTVHADLDCMVCHPAADRYRHNQQEQGDCRQCHQRHEESVAHAAHSDVMCGACHLGHVVPVRDARSHTVAWRSGALPGTSSKIHEMARPAGPGCMRCHFKGNAVGASAMILPPKSVLCMPCHAATFSAGDTTTLVALAVFGVGMLGFIALWFSGTLADTTGGNAAANAPAALKRALTAVFSRKFGVIMATLWYDGFLQRRLFRRSVRRWVIHALIFWPFVIRFVWAVAALTATNWFKDWPLAWTLINKNHPVTALLFDTTGMLLAVGIVLALVRGGQADKTRSPGLPHQDRLALGLLAGIVMGGFVLEGLRIAMTGAAGSAAFAFIGFGVSRLFSGMAGLTQVYGYVWYLHAILTGAFVAYIPFSRMMHMIMSPIVLAMNAATQNEGH